MAFGTPTQAVRSGDHGGGGAVRRYSWTAYRERPCIRVPQSRRTTPLGRSVRSPEVNACSNDRPFIMAARPQPVTPYQKAAQVWDDRIGSARVQARNWRLMAFGCLLLSAGLAAALVWQSAQGTDHAVGGRGRSSRTGTERSRRQIRTISRPIRKSRFISRASSSMSEACPRTPSCCAQDWLRAYDFTTDRGAAALNDYARNNDPFAKLGKTQVAVEVSSVIRASPDSFRIAWIERRYDNGQLAATERWTAILTVVIETAARSPIACGRTRSASTSTPSTGQRSSDSDPDSLLNAA